MRTMFYSILVMMGMTLCLQANAKIWRLNNNGNNTLPLIVADFPSSTTLQQAHDNAAVQNGDTIHLEQSPTSYGNCIFTKRLVVIGAGYYLSTNSKTQVNTDYASTVGSLTIINPAAANTVITGLTSNAAWYVGANNVTISRNLFLQLSGVQLYIGTGNATSCDGINVHQNYFQGSINNWAIYYSGTGNMTNISIIGNILGGNYGIAMPSNATGILKNNLLLNTNNPISVSNFYVVNNMTRSVNNVPNTFYNSTVEYNMGHHANQFVSPSGTGNAFGPGNFTTAYSVGAWGFVASTPNDAYYQLLNSSPAKTSGKNGEELGAFGGSIPYKLSGIPTVPNIYAMSIAPINPGASSISVTVSAKSNN